jgi:hypothetical protein
LGDYGGGASLWGFGRELRLNAQKGTIHRSVKMGYASENKSSEEAPNCLSAIAVNVENRKLKDTPRRLPAVNMTAFLVKLPSSWKNMDRKSMLNMTSTTKGVKRSMLKVSRRHIPLMNKKKLCTKR